MRLLFTGGLITSNGWVIDADSVVRTELNGERPLHDPTQIIYAMTDNPYEKVPVMPRPFPDGTWEVYDAQPRRNKYLAPYFIPTNAVRDLPVWALDCDGGYDHPTRDMVEDRGYGLHHWSGRTTVGCIRVKREEDILMLVKRLVDARRFGDSVLLTVGG